MKDNVVEIKVKGVLPTANGCAIFLGPNSKTFVIYIDPTIGESLSMALKQEKRDRPLTHNLIDLILTGFGITLRRVVINDVENNTFFARMILEMENEVGKKIVEIDARPSDAMVLAYLQQSPIYASREVIETVDDVSDVLQRLQEDQQ